MAADKRCRTIQRTMAVRLNPAAVAGTCMPQESVSSNVGRSMHMRSQSRTSVTPSVRCRSVWLDDRWRHGNTESVNVVPA